MCHALHVCNAIMIAGYVEIANKQGVFGKRVPKSQQQRPNRQDGCSINSYTTKSDVAMLNHFYLTQIDQIMPSTVWRRGKLESYKE